MKSILLALVVFTNPALLSAQVAVLPQDAGVSNGRVTLDVRNTSLNIVLDDIARQGKVRVSYQREQLGSARVTAQVKDATVRDALRKVLANTNLQVVSLDGGQLAVVPGRKSTQAHGVITGKVSDAKTGRGISSANITVDNDSRGTMTGEDGSYRLAGVGAGTHTVSVRLVGYAKQTRVITVGEGTAVTADFKLEASANILNEVVVTGTVVATELKAVPSAMTVITAKQIEQRGITRIDQLFRGEIPGLFSLEQGAGATLDQVIMYSRGATKISTGIGFSVAAEVTNPIKTYIDGVELVDAQFLSQVDPKSIERIEILTGPQASTIYGAGALNGIIQIFTKRGSTVKPSIMLSLSEGFAQNNFRSALSPSHQYDGNISGTEGKLSYNVGSSWNYAGAWSPGKQTQRTSLYGGSRYQVGTFSMDMSARQGWTRNKRQGSILQVLTALAEDGKLSRTGFSGLIVPGKSSLVGRTLGVTLGYTPFSWWSHQISVGNDDSDQESISLTASFEARTDTSMFNGSTSNNRLSQSYSSTLRIPIISLAQATLTYGGDHWRTQGQSIGWTRNLDGSLANSSISRAKPAKNSGAYIQGQLGIKDALFLTYGVRADWNPNYGEKAKVRPGRYGASYSKEFGLLSVKLRGSYGRSIKPPSNTLKDGLEVLPIVPTSAAQLAVFISPGFPLYSTLPNPNLGPEFQQGGEGGVELYLGNLGSVVITRYNQTVDGLINTVANVDSIQALVPGFIASSGTTLCDGTSDLRSDGYCYKVQQKNLNVGSIRNQGWELQGSVNTGPLTTRGTYSWVKSRVVGITPRYRALLTGQAFTPGQTFNYVPEHVWAINVSYTNYGTSISLNVDGVGQKLRGVSDSDLALLTISDLRLRIQEAYSFANLSSFRIPISGYTTTHMNASHRFSSNLEATLQVINLMNYYHNDLFYAYPTLGRTSRFGLRWRL